jgi:hypothetical protein
MNSRLEPSDAIRQVRINAWQNIKKSSVGTLDFFYQRFWRKRLLASPGDEFDEIFVRFELLEPLG